MLLNPFALLTISQNCILMETLSLSLSMCLFGFTFPHGHRPRESHYSIDLSPGVHPLSCCCILSLTENHSWGVRKKTKMWDVTFLKCDILPTGCGGHECFLCDTFGSWDSGSCPSILAFVFFLSRVPQKHPVY